LFVCFIVFFFTVDNKNGEIGTSAFELFFPTTFFFFLWNVFDCSDADESIAFGSRRGCRN
jgi:hypothetical protein